MVLVFETFHGVGVYGELMFLERLILGLLSRLHFSRSKLQTLVDQGLAEAGTSSTAKWV